MIVDRYILEGKTPVPEPDPFSWAMRMEQFNQRVLAHTKVGDVLVSTVFLGLDHSFFREGPPVLFETMVFGGPMDQEQWRYCTWDEAFHGHHVTCLHVIAAQLRLTHQP